MGSPVALFSFQLVYTICITAGSKSGHLRMWYHSLCCGREPLDSPRPLSPGVEQPGPSWMKRPRRNQGNSFPNSQPGMVVCHQLFRQLLYRIAVLEEQFCSKMCSGTKAVICFVRT